jgi:serine/threonine-protein kinase
MPTLPLRAKDVFLQALEVPQTERDAFVAEACGTDARLREEVQSLLAYHEESTAGSAEPSGAITAPLTDGATSRFAAGQVFAGRYRMIARIGKGGMGEVWHADDLVLRTPVALKFIRSAREGAVAGILNEVRLARKITHPAVCRVFDVGQADGEVFFSMELVRGEDLASLIKRVGRLPSEKVIDIARQLCGGLAAAHAEGILHRDLKPANLLIDQDGQVRITDFGIAVTRVDPSLHTAVGTPGYMAPEQLLPGAPLTERTDVYALGLVLYELVVGQHPFSRTGTRMEPTRPSTLVPYVDAQLERLILRALSTDPDDRPASAEAFAASLPTTTPVVARDAREVVAGRERRLRRRSDRRPRDAVLPLAQRAGADRAGHDRARRLHEHDRRTGVRRRLEVALAVAIEQSPFLKSSPTSGCAKRCA